jgi:hypothetical protein
MTAAPKGILSSHQAVDALDLTFGRAERFDWR